MARTISSTSASIAPDDFTWRTSSVDRAFVGISAIDVEDERLVRRVEVALHLHDVDARAGRRGGDRAERPSVNASPTAMHERERRATNATHARRTTGRRSGLP